MMTFKKFGAVIKIIKIGWGILKITLLSLDFFSNFLV